MIFLPVREIGEWNVALLTVVLDRETTTLLRFQQLEKLFFVHMHIIVGFVIGCKITAFLQILQYAF